MKPLKFGKMMTNEEVSKRNSGIKRIKEAVESLAKKRKLKLDDIMFNIEIELINEGSL